MSRSDIRKPQIPAKPMAFFMMRPDWLDKRQEEILEPQLPIVDPHHHIWTVPGDEFLVADLVTDMKRGHNVRATVAVEARAGYRTDGPDEMKPLGEPEFFLRQVKALDPAFVGDLKPCAAIVGHADLRLGAAVSRVLEGLAEVSEGRLRGIRHTSATHPDPALRLSPSQAPAGLLLDDTVRKGFAVLKSLGLSFDSWLYHPQIPEMTSLARAFPDTTIILDHMGGPVGIGPYALRRDEAFQEWRSLLAELATCQNVHVKVGGFGMPIIGLDFSAYDVPPSSEELASAWRPYIETCVELFGPARCMFESNFPVDKGMFSYVCLWNALKIVSRQYSTQERSALFSGTAAKVYRLPAAELGI